MIIFTRRISDDSKDSDTVNCKWVEINFSKKTVTVDGKSISLTWNEYDILKKLIEEKGGIVTRETIMTEIIWYDKYIYDRTIDTHIKNLRRKVWKKDFILTIRWEWYRINM